MYTVLYKVIKVDLARVMGNSVPEAKVVDALLVPVPVVDLVHPARHGSHGEGQPRGQSLFDNDIQ